MLNATQTPLIENSTEDENIINIDLSAANTTSPLPERPVSQKDNHAKNIAMTVLLAFAFIILVGIFKMKNDEIILNLLQSMLQMMTPIISVIAYHYFTGPGSNHRQGGR